MLDERTITVTAFARATSKVRIRRVFLSLLLLLVLATVGTGAAYQAFLNHTPKLNIKQAALLPGRGVVFSSGEKAPTKGPSGRGRQELPAGWVGQQRHGGPGTFGHHRPGAHQR